MLAAVREVAPRARVVLVTTGEVYGAIDPARDLPIAETQPLRPLSPYSVSKAAADLAGFQTFWSQSLDVVRARPFNHTGPGQPPEFVCSEFARALGDTYDGLRVIKSGLAPEDRVVINGVARIRPGQKVTPEEDKSPAPGQAKTDAKNG